MLKLDFTANWNGKLFMDHFGDLREHNPLINFVGQEMEITIKDLSIGFAKIVAVRVFPWSKISDVIAFLNVGKGAAYQAEIMRRMCGVTNQNQHDVKIDHLVFEWIQRDLKVQSELLTEWWHSKTV